MNEQAVDIYQPDSKPFGLTYCEWSVKWWKWLISIPKIGNPTNDLDGKNANNKQIDRNVFFLCQTVEGNDSFRSRTISIPKQKGLFIPLINYISTIKENGNTDEEIMKDARERIDRVSNLQFFINDVPIKAVLKEFRFMSPCFNAYFCEDNILDISSGFHRCVSDGYWILLNLNKDIKTLSTFGSCSSGATQIGITYTIKIR